MKQIIKKNQPVKLSNITQSLIRKIYKLEYQFAKNNGTGVINKTFRFAEIKIEIKQLEKMELKSCKFEKW